MPPFLRICVALPIALGIQLLAQLRRDHGDLLVKLVLFIHTYVTLAFYQGVHMQTGSCGPSG